MTTTFDMLSTTKDDNKYDNSLLIHQPHYHHILLGLSIVTIPKKVLFEKGIKVSDSQLHTLDEDRSEFTIIEVLVQ
jgi:hypothetical protein